MKTSRHLRKKDFLRLRECEKSSRRNLHSLSILVQGVRSGRTVLPSDALSLGGNLFGGLRKRLLRTKEMFQRAGKTASKGHVGEESLGAYREKICCKKRLPKTGGKGQGIKTV